MSYSFFPNDFQNLPNLQDQLFLMKQKQAAALNEYYAPSRDKEAKPFVFDAKQKTINQFMPSRPTGEESKPQPSLIPPAGTVLPPPSGKFKPRKGDIKEPEGGSMPSKEEIDKFASRLKADKAKKEADKASGGIAGGLGVPPETPRKPGRGVTKSGKMITITDPGFTNTSGMIDGSGRRNVNRDKDGNVQITYGISGPPEGMSSGGEDYVSVGDDFDDKTSNPTEYYNTKAKQREADMASFKQSLSRGNREKSYIQ